ncbi:uncharacterized protein HMPREF1541_03674 [Cyphellophora europaea CBS 101466]|uniref:AB hydrolase-1 domain-containing protein n=1 Tax=Cyphellophora europaea (strain CBS 101466) TaxID=1220924 RepID=W2RZ55_CYPE1|nr:uncharacterized protein HMPREF1541_03674 [Cyphellophora europaea CBS 101466]ETN41737.1 hypothetical protein HMPREF1541_03674 [Cyphellophora europaea CBS 101466]
MAGIKGNFPVDINLPRPMLLENTSIVEAPTHQSFIETFGDAFPDPQFLTSDLGRTAVYNLFPSTGQVKRRVLFIHGLNTPALGLWPLAKELREIEPDAHIVMFDLWGHCLSSTPLLAHTPHIFHLQILQVLGYMKWTSAHIIGYSFGGSTAVSFAINNPWLAESVALLAPAGIMSMSLIPSHMQELLKDSKDREEEAREVVLSWLEGGPLIVPENWRTESEQGKVVAQALRHWELQHHQGYPYSVLSMFRDGGCMGIEERFRQFARLPFKKMAALAEDDPVASKEQLVELGIEDVTVVSGGDHSFVREREHDVAEIVAAFWKQ